MGQTYIKGKILCRYKLFFFLSYSQGTLVILEHILTAHVRKQHSLDMEFLFFTLKLFRNTLQAFLITLVFVNNFFKVNAWKLYSLSTAKWLGRYNDSTLGLLGNT